MFIKGSGQDFTDFKTQVGWFEHFEALAIPHQFVDEISDGCRAQLLQHDAVFEWGAVRQGCVDSERREHPSLNGVVVEHVRVGDVIFVVMFRVALDDDAEHIEDGVLVAIEGETVERICSRSDAVTQWHLCFSIYVGRWMMKYG